MVIGGGNVSMDATRTAIRLGAASVTCVYRRRVDDMTALPEEIEDALAEGCQILPLQAPHRIEADEEGKVAALWTRPQIIGGYGRDGRPGPRNAAEKEFRIPCDYIIIAIGQRIESDDFEKGGIGTSHGALQADLSGYVPGTPNVFAGGDAVTGPATVIRAVAAGKVGAANIDAFLGFHHVIGSDVRHPARQAVQHPALRAHPAQEPQSAGGPHRLQACHLRHDRGGGHAGGRALPAVRPLRLRHLQGREDDPMVNVTVNGSPIAVPEGTTILNAARAAGVEIPHLCYLKGLNEIGACRICCVEIEGERNLVPSCNNPVFEGMVIRTNTERVRRTRRINVELILSQHDCKCATCVRSGNCQLQTIANDLGILDNTYPQDLVTGIRALWPKDFPLYRDTNKCIKCMRCIQVCDKIQGCQRLGPVAAPAAVPRVDVIR